MTKFEDFIRSIDPSVTLPENFLSSLQSAYDEDMGLITAKNASLETEIAGKQEIAANLERELTASKAKNYDLLMALPADETNNEPKNSDELIVSDDELDDIFQTN